MPLLIRSWVGLDAHRVQRTTVARAVLLHPPTAAIISDLASAGRRHRKYLGDRISTLTPTTVALSLLVHAAVLLATMLLLPDRAEPPAMPAEANFALVFAPAPAVVPPVAEVASPIPDSIAPAAADPTLRETQNHESTPTPDLPPSTPAPTAMPAPIPTISPAPAPLPVAPAPPQDMQRVHRAASPAAQARSPKPPTTAHSGPAPTPFASRTPPQAVAPAETQSTAVGSVSPAETATLVPPRPVTGMETNRAPVYPEIARQRGEQGRVLLRVSVSATGIPLGVVVMDTSGHPSLDSAALSAVREWRFIPATQAGRSVAAVADVPVRFRLDN
jgi:protein TonB